jgi:hypothetical protein
MSLWQAIAIIMIVSFISLGARAGTVVALSIPLTLAPVLPHYADRRDTMRLQKCAGSDPMGSLFKAMSAGLTISPGCLE